MAGTLSFIRTIVGFIKTIYDFITGKRLREKQEHIADAQLEEIEEKNKRKLGMKVWYPKEKYNEGRTPNPYRTNFHRSDLNEIEIYPGECVLFRKWEDGKKLKDENEFIDLHKLLEVLASRGIKTLMVEGGSTVIWNFLKHQLVDDLYVYIGSIIIGGKATPTLADGQGISNIDELIHLKIVEVKKLDSGILIHYKMIK